MTTPSFVEQMNAAQDDKPATTPRHGPPYDTYPMYSGTGYKGYKPPVDTLIEVVDAEGKPYKTFTLPSTYNEWLPLARRHYPKGATEKSVVIPKDRCTFTYGTPKFNACTFDATDSYLAARWGRKLHYSDRDWLSLHQYATDDGVPTEYTLICLQQLMEPYGMGISAVRIRKGSLAAGKQITQFANALGCNPMGLFDHQTSNETAAKALGIELEQAKQLWRFEFADTPLPGCTVLCERGVTSTSEFTTGYSGGHARYLAPRAQPGNWVLSFQFAPLELISYDTPIIFPDYVVRRGDESLDLDGVFQPDGVKRVAVKVNNWYKDPDEAAEKEAEEKARKSNGFQTWQPRHSEGSDEIVDTSEPETPKLKVARCLLCYIDKPVAAMEEDADCCTACYNKAWKGYKCPTCNIRFDNGNVPKLIERFEGIGFAKFSCPGENCETSIQVFECDNKETPELVFLIKTLPSANVTK